MFGIAKRKELEKLVAMNMFGIGPRLVLSGGAGVAAVLLLRKFLGGTLHLPTVWTPGLRIAGGILLLIGCWFWFDSARRMVPAFRSRQLATGGVYGLCRNPMYAAFIVFIIPGLALVANEFLILIVAVMGFDFLTSTALAKIANLTTNVAAIVVFVAAAGIALAWWLA